MYANELSKPMLSYRFDEGAGAKKEEAMTDFVSAVCWDNVNLFNSMNLKPLYSNSLILFYENNKKLFQNNHLLAANSQGVVKVLELV